MNNILLPQNHITMTSGNNITDLCQPLFASSGITHFVYGRVFDDDTCYFLSNNVHFINDYLSKGYKVTASAPHSLLNKKFSYLVSKNGDHSQAMQDAITHFNVDNIVNFVDGNDGFYDLFCLGSGVNNDSIINFYLNNLDYLNNFFDYFKKQASQLLIKAEKEKHVVPSNMKPNFNSTDLSRYCLEKNSTTLQNQLRNMQITLESKQNIKFSKREIQCLFYLLQGKSAREMGDTIHLSPRTIEFHLANLKDKFHCRKKSELIGKILLLIK